MGICIKILEGRQVFRELEFWLKHLNTSNVRHLTDYAPIKTLVYSDTSDIAAGSYVVNCKNRVFRSIWSDEEAGRSSSFRELRAVKLALQVYGDMLKGKTVKWF